MSTQSSSSHHVVPVHCANLRHKGMYVASDSHDGQLDGYRDHIEATAFWCAITQKAFGPDGRPATAELCKAGRRCCE